MSKPKQSKRLGCPVRPMIGVTANRFPPDPKRPVFKNMELHYGEANMFECIYKAGGLPVLIPDLKNKKSFEEYLEKIDGVVLSGGADVCPESYGKNNFDARWPGDKIRDEYEISLIQNADKSGKPIFGVCRGLQVLNVAFGGTLFQDIITEKPNSFTHRDWNIYEQNHHEVKLEKNSWIEVLYKKPNLRVNSIHHQGVQQLAPCFRPVATSPDGIVEAIEEKSGKPIRAVQWHPEWGSLFLLNDRIDSTQILFEDFIALVRKLKKT